MTLEDEASELGAAQARHEDIGEQDVQPLDPMFRDIGGIRGGLRFEHGIAGGTEDFDDRLAQRSFIVGDENCDSVTCGGFSIGNLWRKRPRGARATPALPKSRRTIVQSPGRR
jgi:hypothetical protein